MLASCDRVERALERGKKAAGKRLAQAKLGILVGSLVSALSGYFLLRRGPVAAR